MDYKTTVGIEGTEFLINGHPTYEGRQHEGRSIQGLLMNSRMIQGIFHDESPATAKLWVYPDTGVWDPARNTRELCDALPMYHAAGLRAVTVGLQGGGPNFAPGIYEEYRMSAFHADGTLKPDYFERLLQVLAAADACGMVVIVNFFYWRQVRFHSDDALLRGALLATEWLLASGYRNILTDINNEIREGEGIIASRGIGKVLDVVRGTTLDGRRLLVGTSTFPTNHLPDGDWYTRCDYLMPHGNDSTPEGLRQELRELWAWEADGGRRRPIMINEDSTDIGNLDAAVDSGVSWGYYDQGYGSAYKHMKMDWTLRGREPELAQLSGYQTPPVNWGINTEEKRAFFTRVAEITGGTLPV